MSQVTIIFSPCMISLRSALCLMSNLRNDHDALSILTVKGHGKGRPLDWSVGRCASVVDEY